MKQHYMCIIFVVFCIFGNLSADPSAQISNYTSHKNYNLLPPKNICGNNDNALEDKVYGGTVANLGEFPWIARLKYNDLKAGTTFKCAGILINQRYVLTAAHCTIKQGEIVQIRLGEHDERKNPDFVMLDENLKITADLVLDVDVEEVITHNQYNTSIKHNDIALIRMKQTINYTKYIAPVCLPLNGEKAQSGHTLVVSGWGLTENNVTSPEKLKAYVHVVSQEKCLKLYRRKHPVVPTQICAGRKEGMDACKGDSGGPLMNAFAPDTEKYYLEGIVSFGPINCGSKHYPGIYTRVSEFLDWILDNMKPF